VPGDRWSGFDGDGFADGHKEYPKNITDMSN
jgi:hypothetical protein